MHHASIFSIRVVGVVLRLPLNENVNEQWGIANGGAASKPPWLFLQVDRAQRACGLASLDGPLCKRYLGQNGWAWYSQRMGDSDAPPSFLKFFFYGGNSCHKGSTVCNVIHCKFYTEEIYVIKGVHLSEESDPWSGHYHCVITGVMSGPLATVFLINSGNSKASGRKKT